MRSTLPATVGLLTASLAFATWDPPLAVRHDRAALAAHFIAPAALPPPGATESHRNPPRVMWQPGDATLWLPAGFTIEPYASGLRGPRAMVETAGGDLFVVESRANRVSILRDADGDGRLAATERHTFAAGLRRPAGLALSPSHVYVGQTDGVIAFPYAAGELAPRTPAQTVADLPPLGYREHWTRYVALAPDGATIYVTVGSRTDAEIEEDLRRGTILECGLEPRSCRIFASGLRNATGLAFQPRTGKLWATVNERDHLGDDLVPDFATAVAAGGFYGWPYAYIGKNPDPRNGAKRPDLVALSRVPDVLIEAHSAPLGIAFYDGAAFPAEYHGDAFVALHGSWNRAERTGYKVVRLRFRDGRPTGGYEDFVVGWGVMEDPREVWGRPTAVLVAHDGSLLVADDAGGRIWRVRYVGG